MVGTRQKKTYLWIMICLMIVSACLPLFAVAERQTYEGPGWATPEEAVTFYLEGLAALDLDKMISAYAVETYVDHFDMQAQLMRFGAYMSSMSPSLPNTNQLLRDLNVEARKNEITQSILGQLVSICLYEQNSAPVTTFDREKIEEETKTFVEWLEDTLSAAEVNTLKVLTFIPPEAVSEVYASERNQANIMAQCAPFEADEARSVIAIFSVGEKIGLLCCDVARYGEQWYMFKALGNIGSLIGLSASCGGVIAMDRHELAALLGDPGANILEMLNAETFAKLFGI